MVVLVYKYAQTKSFECSLSLVLLNVPKDMVSVPRLSFSTRIFRVLPPVTVVSASG